MAACALGGLPLGRAHSQRCAHTQQRMDTMRCQQRKPTHSRTHARTHAQVGLQPVLHFRCCRRSRGPDAVRRRRHLRPHDARLAAVLPAGMGGWVGGIVRVVVVDARRIMPPLPITHTHTKFAMTDYYLRPTTMGPALLLLLRLLLLPTFLLCACVRVRSRCGRRFD
jgi:hypothetical protein